MHNTRQRSAAASSTLFRRFLRPGALLTAVVLTCLLTVQAAAMQSTAERKYRLAQSYEQAGNLDDAARLYLELYNDDPQYDQVYSAVERTLMELQRYGELQPIVGDQAQKQQRPELFALNGNLLWKLGQTDQAFQAWDDGLALNSEDSDSYSAIAQAQIDNRLFDQAIKTLLLGRTRSGRQQTFANDLSQLYGAVGNYREGAREVMTLLEQTGNLPLAQGRISAYLVSERGVTESGEVLEAAAQGSRDQVILEMYEWYLRQIEDYDKAFDVFVRIDDLSGGDGRQMLRFANQVARDGRYDIAIKAFGRIIETGDGSNPHVHSALYGYAQAMEQRMAEGGKFSEEEVREIISRYERILKDFPKSKFAADAQYGLANLHHNYLHDLERAAEEYQTLMANYSSKSVAADGALALGRLYLEEDRLTDAESTFEAVQKQFRKFEDQVKQARFELAELLFYRGSLDSATLAYSGLANDSDKDIANDALNRLLLFGENPDEGAKEHIKVFAKAILRERQSRHDEARKLFQQTAQNAAQSALGELSLLRIGELDAGDGQYSAARASLETLLTQYPETIYGDKAYALIGDTWLAEKATDKAIEAYTHILVNYPDSTLLQEMREKIRSLRDES